MNSSTAMVISLPSTCVGGCVMLVYIKTTLSQPLSLLILHPFELSSPVSNVILSEFWDGDLCRLPRHYDHHKATKAACINTIIHHHHSPKHVACILQSHPFPANASCARALQPQHSLTRLCTTTTPLTSTTTSTNLDKQPSSCSALFTTRHD